MSVPMINVASEGALIEDPTGKMLLFGNDFSGQEISVRVDERLALIGRRLAIWCGAIVVAECAVG